MEERVNLTWNKFQFSTAEAFRNLDGSDDFSDVTLACGDGRQFKAHKVILSSSSHVFKNMLLQYPHKHPLVYMRGLNSVDLQSLIKFIYVGEVEIEHKSLGSFFTLANEFQVAGLAKPKREKQDESFADDDQVRSIDMEANSFMIQDTVTTEDVSLPTEETMTPNSLSFENSTDDLKYTENVEMTTSAKVGDLFNFDNDPSDAFVKDEETITPSSLSFTIDEKTINYSTKTSGVSCNYCLKQFSTAGNLKMHIQAAHEGMRFV